jgi:hypothetical protein
MKKILIIIFCFLTGCGYQSIYIGQNKSDFVFKNINLIGDKSINKKIIFALNLREDKSNQNLNEIILNTSKTVVEISKNSKGQIASYRTTVQLNLIIKKNGKQLKNKNFTESFSYNNMDNKFNLSSYQNEVEKNLTDKIIEELIIYLSV